MPTKGTPSERKPSPAKKGSTAPKSGRPTGTTALTREVEETILAYIRAGGFKHVAAESAGISARTFREWMARGEGTHPTRKPTPALRRFAAKVNTAEAQARMSAEARVHEEHPKFWLTHAARTKGDREGWTEPGKGSGPGERGGPGASDEAARDELERLLQELLASGELRTPRCSHARCQCPHHRTKKRPTTQKERKR